MNEDCFPADEFNVRGNLKVKVRKEDFILPTHHKKKWFFQSIARIENKRKKEEKRTSKKQEKVLKSGVKTN